MQERHELLAAMAVFGALNEPTLELITGLAEPVTVASGEHFFLEGDKSHDMYVLQSGQVEVYKSWANEARVLGHMQAGDCFGEMALIDLFPRSASVVAVTDCEALKIPPGVLQAIYQADRDQFTLLQMNMSRELSRRMRRLDELLFRALIGESLPDTSFSQLQ